MPPENPCNVEMKLNIVAEMIILEFCLKTELVTVYLLISKCYCFINSVNSLDSSSIVKRQKN